MCDEKKDSESVYESPAKAKAALTDAYGYWSGKLTDHSIQLAIAIVAAHWAVPDRTARLGNLAGLSLFVIMIGLSAVLLGTFALSEKHLSRYKYAEEDWERWSREYQDTLRKNVPWPFTEDIDGLALLLRWIKLLYPLTAAALFALSLAVERAAPLK